MKRLTEEVVMEKTFADEHVIKFMERLVEVSLDNIRENLVYGSSKANYEGLVTLREFNVDMLNLPIIKMERIVLPGYFRQDIIDYLNHKFFCDNIKLHGISVRSIDIVSQAYYRVEVTLKVSDKLTCCDEETEE